MRSRARLIIIGLFACIGILVELILIKTGLPIKEFWAYLSVNITLTGYAIYISQMYPDCPDKVKKPQPLSWIGFGFLTGGGWLIQVAQGGGSGSWCLGVTAFACLIIGIWSLIKFSWRFDFLSILAAIAGISLFILSVFTKDVSGWATLSAIFATGADVAFYEPTVKRGWRLPYEESITTFVFNSVKCIPALLALSHYSFATTIYLSMLTVVNGAVAIMLLYRRLQSHHSLSVGFNL